MAGHARYTAMLDACVLYTILTEDLFITLAAAGFYAAKWTEQIEAEGMANLEKDKPDLQGKLETRRDLMRDAVAGWEVKGGAWQSLMPCMTLPSQKDHHVLAAAIAGHSDCVVTANVRDFPVGASDHSELKSFIRTTS